jgi:predicted permease
VVGVLPREFAGTTPGEKTELYISLTAIPKLMPDVVAHAPPDPWFFWPMARLKPNVHDAEFEAALNVAFASAAGPFMKEPAIRITDGRAGPDDVRSVYRTSLLLLLGVVGVVLLVACANVAGLMLARGAGRQHEFAVRAALGAGRGRLMRQALTESLLIALLGGGLGVLFASWGKTVALQLIVQRQMNYAPALDQRVLVFTLLATLVAALLSGLWPALRAAGIDPLNGLKEKAALGAPRLRAGRILVAAQIALALLLVAGAGLFVHSLINVAKINPGFATDHLLMVQLAPRNEGYSNTQQIAYFDRVQESLAAIPGVRSVALTEMELLGGSREFGFSIPGQSVGQNVDVSIVGERFFATMGIPIVLGRELRPGDDEGATKVIVVNQAFVHKYFPDRDPIGLTIEKSNDNQSIWQIVGVCRDARYVDLKSEAEPRVHFSFRQYPLRWGASVCLRTALPPLAMATAARQALATVDPNIPVSEIRTEDQLREESMSQERMFATLCGSLAVLALLLSCIGLYGLMAYHVSQRTSEIGIRMALGATRGQIAGPILREALLLAGAGGALGLPLALVLNRFVRSSLYDVKPSDPITLGCALVLLVVIGVMSAWIPARRAASVDPMIALRHE